MNILKKIGQFYYHLIINFGSLRLKWYKSKEEKMRFSEFTSSLFLSVISKFYHYLKINVDLLKLKLHKPHDEELIKSESYNDKWRISELIPPFFLAIIGGFFAGLSAPIDPTPSGPMLYRVQNTGYRREDSLFNPNKTSSFPLATFNGMMEIDLVNLDGQIPVKRPQMKHIDIFNQDFLIYLMKNGEEIYLAQELIDGKLTSIVSVTQDPDNPKKYVFSEIQGSYVCQTPDGHWVSVYNGQVISGPIEKDMSQIIDTTKQSEPVTIPYCIEPNNSKSTATFYKYTTNDGYEILLKDQLSNDWKLKVEYQFFNFQVEAIGSDIYQGKDGHNIYKGVTIIKETKETMEPHEEEQIEQVNQSNKYFCCSSPPSPPKRYQIFISLIFKNLADERQAVLQAIFELNFIPFGIELSPASDDVSWQLITNAIDSSDYYVLIIADFYGSLDEKWIGYIEKEYDYAVKTKKPIIPFLYKNPDNLPCEKSKTNDKTWEMLKSFSNNVEKNHHCIFWESADDLKVKMILQLKDIQQ
jgi:hypothetical protein